MSTIVEKIRKNNERYNTLIGELEETLTNIDDLNSSEIESVKENVGIIENVIKSFDSFTKKIANKIIKSNKSITEEDISSYSKKLISDGNFTAAVKYLEGKASENNEIAMSELGNLYIDGYTGIFGEVSGIDYGKAKYWLLKSYEYGNLGSGYLAGVVCLKESKLSEAENIFEKLFQNNGHLKAAYELIIINKIKMESTDDPAERLELASKINNIKSSCEL